MAYGRHHGCAISPHSIDLGQAGDLAGAVEHEAAAGQPVHEDVALVGEDGGDAGAHRALAGPQRALAVDDGAVADEHALDVGDRVDLPGLKRPSGRSSSRARTRGTVQFSWRADDMGTGR